MNTVAIQGITGAFHHQAAEQFFGESITPVECVTFQDVFDAVLADTVDCGVVAIENNIHGPISPVYRLLVRTQLWIAGELTLPIEYFLVGSHTATLASLNTQDTEVRTMFPAFAQTELWLNEHLPKARRTEVFDTAVAVREVMEVNDPHIVALAGKQALQTYGGTVIAGPIKDDPHNQTRFVFLYKDRQPTTGATRTMLILQTGHTPGALYNALGVLAAHEINLSKLDSHPIPGDARHYSFYIDCDAGVDDAAMQTALAELTAQGCTCKILGSYRA